ncbi:MULTISPECIES: hypothetical protein [Cupriavidus]|uniref:hypothetical protein n=1 Tax=Cupriavidus pauculus TaxID=82633 RepID=UPI001C936CDA|nr:hypothetical protein [Cupriavidus pauculus]MBY4731759.1 hypothetical protein [Cupriavidus pauculus]
MRAKNARADKGCNDAAWTISRINAHIISVDLKIADDWILEVAQLPSEGGGLFKYDLREIYLPGNSLVNRAISLVDHPEFAAVLVMLVDNYLGRSKNTHSRSVGMKACIRFVAYYLEVFWYNDCTSLKVVPQTLFDAFAVALASGGLLKALSIKQRLEALKMELPEKRNTRAGARVLGTNFLTFSAAIRNDAVGQKNTDDGPTLSASFLNDFFNAANYLFDLPSDLRTTYRPYPKAYALSRLLGAKGESTKNLSNDKAGRLIRVSFLWLYERAPLLIALLREIVDACIDNKKKSRKMLGRKIPQIFAASERRRALEEILPFPLEKIDIVRGRDESHSLREAVTSLLTACFILIAFMNARRKGEVSHPYVGLHTSSLRIIDEALELYVVGFFLQKKGHQVRVPYFVNKTTRDAIGVLTALQAEFRRLDDVIAPDSFEKNAMPGEHPSLFAYRRFSTAFGVNKKARIFDFAATLRSSDSRSLLVEALGKNAKIDGQTHVFRRMYSIMYYYRFENGDIQALSHQLGHEAVMTTVGYIGDSLSRPDFQSVFDISSADVELLKRAAYADASDLRRDLEDAGNEKLMKEIVGVLNGGKFAGGYQKIVNRLALKMAGMVSFHGDIEDKAEAVFQAVKNRGHFPSPMKHGQCFLGSSEKKRSARCFSKTDGVVHRERAGPDVCGKCVFHLTKAAYLRNLVNDNEKQRRRLQEDALTGLQRQRIQLDCDNLEIAIRLLRERLGIT